MPNRSCESQLLPNRCRSYVGVGAFVLLASACGGEEGSNTEPATAGGGSVSSAAGAGATIAGSGGASAGAGATSAGAGAASAGAGAASAGSSSEVWTDDLGPVPQFEPESAVCPELAGAAPSTAPHRITIDSADTWGELPHFWNSFGTGHLGLYQREDRDWGSLLQEHTIDGVENLGMKRIRSHGLFHDDIGIYTEVEGEPVFNFEISDQIFDFLNAQGIVPIIELGPMPLALAADPTKTVFDWNMIISPPKDYALWEELVREFAQHSLDRYGAETVSQWDWEVWNEPECCTNKFWGGTLLEYFQLYDSAVAGVRSVLPEGRVGGPVTSQPLELRDLSRAGELFLDHVIANDSPLDFFSYHSWSFVGGSVDGYFQGLDLLDDYGKTDVPIMITEFGPTWEFGLYDEPQEMHQGAAFAVQTFADISRRVATSGKRWPVSYSWWVLSDVFEEGLYREDDPFIGCMGLISRQGIKKPAYNAYKFLAQMGNEQLPLFVENADGASGVGGMASRSPTGQIQILLYNGQNPGQGPRDDRYYDETEAHVIGLTLGGLDPATTYDIVEYRVDTTHGNAYANWQSMGRPSMTDMTEADWQSLRDSMESLPMPVSEVPCGGVFDKTLSLTSPGVVFLTLTPAG